MVYFLKIEEGSLLGPQSQNLDALLQLSSPVLSQ